MDLSGIDHDWFDLTWADLNIAQSWIAEWSLHIFHGSRQMVSRIQTRRGHRSISSRSNIHGYQSKIVCVDIKHGYHAWISVMYIIHKCHPSVPPVMITLGYYPNRIPMEITQGCHPWITVLNIIHRSLCFSVTSSLFRASSLVIPLVALPCSYFVLFSFCLRR